MATKRINYEKEFLAEKKYFDESMHGSPDWVPYWETNDKAEELIKEIRKEFELTNLRDLSSSLGFDGRFQYSFKLENNFHQKFEREEIPTYKLVCKIVKAGKKEDLDMLLSDLEMGLAKKGFVVQK